MSLWLLLFGLPREPRRKARQQVGRLRHEHTVIGHRLQKLRNRFDQVIDELALREDVQRDLAEQLTIIETEHKAVRATLHDAEKALSQHQRVLQKAQDAYVASNAETIKVKATCLGLKRDVERIAEVEGDLAIKGERRNREKLVLETKRIIAVQEIVELEEDLKAERARRGDLEVAVQGDKNRLMDYVWIWIGWRNDCGRSDGRVKGPKSS